MSRNNSPNLAGLAAIITAIAALITAIGFPNFFPALVKDLIMLKDHQYKAHEQAFYSNSRIQSMTQKEGNGYCRILFTQLKSTGDLGGDFDPNQVNHVWAHIQNGDCVANIGQN